MPTCRGYGTHRRSTVVCRALDFPATAQEHRLRTLMVASPANPWDLADASADASLTAGATLLGARRSGEFTRFDGNLGGLPIPSPVTTSTSATRIQRWAACPFDYLLTEVLGVEPVENPEEALQLSALDWGSLVHEALERFILEVLARDAPPSPDDAWSDADRARMTEIGDEVCAEYEARGVTGRPVFWRRNQVQIHRDLQRFLTADDLNRREKRTRPIAVELGFGMSHSTVGAVPIALPDGRTLHFRGMADRVDVDEHGGLHVVDYKTGRDRYYSGLVRGEPGRPRAARAAAGLRSRGASASTDTRCARARRVLVRVVQGQLQDGSGTRSPTRSSPTSARRWG